MYEVIRGTQAEIDATSIVDGQQLFTTDTNKIYMDNGNIRILYQSGMGTDTYTYLVYNEETLNNWYNNVSGNSYLTVLIDGDIPNETTKEINLSTTGTRVVIGINNSKLNNIVLIGNGSTSKEYYMSNVNIYNNNSVNIQNNKSCFVNCCNLFDCSGISVYKGGAFDGCKYLNRCVGYGAVTFRCCNYLTNCIGSAYSLLSDTDVFSKCNYLNNCICDRVEYYDVGFRRAFYRCNNMNNCLATGGTYTQCFSMLNCSGNRRDVANVYEQSYASSTAISTYACADTPNGGWNH